MSITRRETLLKIDNVFNKFEEVEQAYLQLSQLLRLLEDIYKLYNLSDNSIVQDAADYSSVTDNPPNEITQNTSVLNNNDNIKYYNRGGKVNKYEYGSIIDVPSFMRNHTFLDFNNPYSPTTLNDDYETNVNLDEIAIYPDWELNRRLRLTYPNDYLRHQLMTANLHIVDNYDDMFGYEEFMPSDLPLRNLLQLHNYAAPHISVYAGGNNYSMQRYDSEGNIHNIGRASTDKNSNYFYDDVYDDYAVSRWNDFGIHIDPQLWDKTGLNVWGDLVSEYSHPYNFTHMPFKYHYQPPFLSLEDYDEYYDIPYSDEYMTHQLIEPVLHRNIAESTDGLDFNYINNQIKQREKDINKLHLSKRLKQKAKDNLKSIQKLLKVMKEHNIPEKTENGSFNSIYDDAAGELVYRNGGIIR